MSGLDSQAWIWPELGPDPVFEDLYSDSFDRADFPYSETFVREAIQNSLDARLDSSKPVIVKFTFRSDGIGPRSFFLKQVIDYREAAGSEIPHEWGNGHVHWLTVEDFNSKGLSGSLDDRMSDFWHYWLNFGLSNKDNSGRGGRGIGRVTFMIASRLQSVIAYTRRAEDGKIAVCGMAALRVMEAEGKLRSTHAHLAREAKEGSIRALHESPEFQDHAKKAFAFAGYDGEFTSGLALAVPYPHEELKPEGILAAAIENFAPAIMENQLQLNVDGRELNADSIEEIAYGVAERFNEEAVRRRPGRYLELIRCSQDEAKPERIFLPDASEEDDNVKELQKKLAEGENVILDIGLALSRNGKTSDASVRAILAASPEEQTPIDRLFREGMSLPEIKAKNPDAIDLVMLVDESELATYLNLCEGKAHLGLSTQKEERTKLKKNGFLGPNGGALIKPVQLVKELPVALRRLLTPDAAIPNADTFAELFSVPADASGEKKERKPPVDGPPPPPPLPKIPPMFAIKRLDDGLCLTANSAFEEWPVKVKITLAYADGTRRPSWSPFDFKADELDITHADCEISSEKNIVTASNCGPDTEIKIAGFGKNRELDVDIRRYKNA